ncbi:hypothetical protein PROFUN_16238 [Planoprotostelium fungivorum]|uniref:Uncharacterized protein n=1 Tax=Planoprotostelium fungivorum TaxID=1890364 RepID=A0A2P6MML8_9EUKA|nr:hypothetical protein PROFUN_16238 [Planoprotostelium fungivorum]
MLSPTSKVEASHKKREKCIGVYREKSRIFKSSMSVPVDARNERRFGRASYLCAAEVSGNLVKQPSPDALAKKGVGDERRTFE